MSLPIVVGITGASGVVYGQRLVQVLLELDQEIHLSISDSAEQVLRHELNLQVPLKEFRLERLLPNRVPTRGQLHYYHYQDFMAPIASGSFRTRAMVVCPCSGSTLSGIACAASRNLIQRAADVHLKEKRPLILVTRETPLSLIQIDNMRTVALAGATVMPASPGFYHGRSTVDDLVEFMIDRVLNHLGLDRPESRQWGVEKNS